MWQFTPPPPPVDCPFWGTKYILFRHISVVPVLNLPPKKMFATDVSRQIRFNILPKKMFATVLCHPIQLATVDSKYSEARGRE